MKRASFEFWAPLSDHRDADSSVHLSLFTWVIPSGKGISAAEFLDFSVIHWPHALACHYGVEVLPVYDASVRTLQEGSGCVFQAVLDQKYDHVLRGESLKELAKHSHIPQYAFESALKGRVRFSRHWNANGYMDFLSGRLKRPHELRRQRGLQVHEVCSNVSEHYQ